MSNNSEERAALEHRMLNGGPFTYGQLCVWREKIEHNGGRGGDEDRLIDRTIQKLRRQGLIAFQRAGNATVWNLVSLSDGSPLTTTNDAKHLDGNTHASR